MRLLSWWCPSSKVKDRDAVICDGAVRSGKTMFMGISFALWAMASFSGRKFAVCGKTITSIRRNLISDLLPYLRSIGFEVRELVSKNRFTLTYKNVSNEFYLFGGRDEGSYALIQGVTLAGVLFDEVTLQPESFVNQACARCSVEGSKFWFNCNPEGPNHWFYRQWIKNLRRRNALYMHFTMYDNPSLSDKVRKRYEAMYSGAFYRRYILGLWSAAEGRIYDFFDDSYIKPVPKCEFSRYFVSCDYGTYNPMSMGLWGEHGGVWYRIKEYYFASRREGYQKTDAEYAADLTAFTTGYDIRCVVVDPSAASFIEALRREGFSVRRADNNVLTGIRKTASLLKNGKLVICDTCRDAIREIGGYVWQSTGAGDAPKKEDDHAMDEIRYFAATIAAGDDIPFAATTVER